MRQIQSKCLAFGGWRCRALAERACVRGDGGMHLPRGWAIARRLNVALDAEMGEHRLAGWSSCVQPRGVRSNGKRGPPSAGRTAGRSGPAPRAAGLEPGTRRQQAASSGQRAAGSKGHASHSNGASVGISGAAWHGASVPPNGAPHMPGAEQAGATSPERASLTRETGQAATYPVTAHDAAALPAATRFEAHHTHACMHYCTTRARTHAARPAPAARRDTQRHTPRRGTTTAAAAMPRAPPRHSSGPAGLRLVRG